MLEILDTRCQIPDLERVPRLASGISQSGIKKSGLPGEPTNRFFHLQLNNSVSSHPGFREIVPPPSLILQMKIHFEVNYFLNASKIKAFFKMVQGMRKKNFNINAV
jgi:hypothetical protein